MPIHPEWQDIAVRLLMTVVAGALIGLNRGEQGRPAGLRTTLLVCLAASIAMIQSNLMLGTAGRPSDSFVTLDVMRLPLGILSGMGFIGGGAILKRDNMVKGVTTAATLWFVTVMGLCFGGGQLLLGSVALALGLIVLWCLKWVEELIPRDRQGTLVLRVGPGGPVEDDIIASILAGGYQIVSTGIIHDPARHRYELCCELRWRTRHPEIQQPPILKQLARLPEVSRLKWTPQGTRLGN